MNSYAKFGGAARRRFSAICEKPMGGAPMCPPPAVRGLISSVKNSTAYTIIISLHEHSVTPCNIISAIYIKNTAPTWRRCLKAALNIGVKGNEMVNCTPVSPETALELR